MSPEKELWLPPLSQEAQQRIDLQRKQQADLQKKSHLKKKSYFAWTGFKGKTLWDFLQLLAALAIPVAIAVGTAWFRQHKARQVLMPVHSNTKQISKSLRTSNTKQSFRPILIGWQTCFSIIISGHQSQGVKCAMSHKHEH